MKAQILTPEGMEALTVTRQYGNYIVRVNTFFLRDAFVFTKAFYTLFQAVTPYTNDGLEATYVVSVPQQLQDDFLDILTNLYDHHRS